MIKDHYEMIRKNKIAFWWFSARRDLFRAMLEKFSRGPFAVAADVGSGPGTNESLYRSFAERWIALDHSRESFSRWRPGEAILPAIAEVSPMPLRKGSVELALMLDVLEHIEDDRGALAEAASALAEGGLLLVSVPAFSCLWSRHDEQAGHRRRYTGPELLDLGRSAGFEVLDSRYFNCTLFLPIWAIRKMLKALPSGRETLEISLSPKLTDPALSALLKLENRISMNLVRMPFGTSFIALLRKKR